MERHELGARGCELRTKAMVNDADRRGLCCNLRCNRHRDCACGHDRRHCRDGPWLPRPVCSGQFGDPSCHLEWGRSKASEPIGASKPVVLSQSIGTCLTLSLTFVCCHTQTQPEASPGCVPKATATAASPAGYVRSSIEPLGLQLLRRQHDHQPARRILQLLSVHPELRQWKGIRHRVQRREVQQIRWNSRRVFLSPGRVPTPV